MKVYTKVVIDMLTLEVLEEESCEYDGPVALCGGGGGSSGEIIYPAYMMDIHKDWLNNQDTHYLVAMGTGSVNSKMHDAMQLTPYTSNMPYDPDTRVTNMSDRWDYYYDMVNDLLTATPLTGPVSDIIDAFTTKQTIELNTIVYPRFEAGMLDINSVQSSAFVQGRALIESRSLDAIAEFSAKVTIENEINMREHVKALAHMGVEIERLSIIAKSEYQTRLADQAALAGLWDLEIFKYGCNVMASIGSASVHTGQKSVSAGVSAMGGAMSGAMAGLTYGSTEGSLVSPGWGTAIGAVLGGIAGYLGA